MQKLTLIRGLPNTGKSTMARNMVLQHIVDNPWCSNIPVHIEADMYFMINGVYQFDPVKLKNAHYHCYSAADALLELGRSVIVSNTFTKNWEMEDYIVSAQMKGIPYEVIETTREIKGDNGHGCPPEKVKLMGERWEKLNA